MKNYVKLEETHLERFINGSKVSFEEYYKIFDDMKHYKQVLYACHINKYNELVRTYILEQVK